MLYTIISVLIIITCILIVLIVLAQNSKGGGLAAGMTGASQMIGVRKTTDFMEKATWVLALSLLILSLGASMTVPRGAKNSAEDEIIQNQIQNAANPQNAMPTQQPKQEQTPKK